MEKLYFRVKGMSLSRAQICDWWERLYDRDPRSAMKYGDPNYNDAACHKIAGKIVDEINARLGNTFTNMSNDYEYRGIKEEKEKAAKKQVVMSDQYSMPRDIDWTDQIAVTKRAIEEAEKRYKEKKKQEEESKKNNYVPEPEVKKEIDWREVLKIPLGIKLTKDIIKKYFSKRAMICHPDRGGSNEKMDELFKARDLALMFIGEYK